MISGCALSCQHLPPRSKLWKITQLITFADIGGHCSIITKCPHIGQQWSLMFMLLNCGAMDMATGLFKL